MQDPCDGQVDRQLGLALGASEAGMEPLSRSEVEAHLARLNRPVVVDHFARINFALGHGGLGDHAFQDWFATSFLKLDRRQKLNEFIVTHSPKRYGLLDPRQMRMVLKLVLTHSLTEGGESFEDPTVRGALGDVLLSIRETYMEAGAESEPPEDTPEYRLWLEIQMQQGGFYHTDELRVTLGLHSYVLSRLLDEAGLRSKFVPAVGCSPEEYFKAVFVLFAHFRQLTPMHVRTIRSTNLDPRYAFGKCRVPQSVGSAVLKHCAFDVMAPPPVGTMVGAVPAYADFGLFIRRPYVFVAENALACVDAYYASDHLARCLHMVLADALGSEVVSGLYEPKGHVFEDLCSHVMGQIASARAESGAVWVPPGTYQGAEIDGLYWENGAAILFEAKSGLVPTGKKLSTDTRNLAEHLSRKYVGTDARPEGLRQLTARVERVATQPGTFGIGEVRSLFPVLAVEDEFVASKMPAEFIIMKGRDLFDTDSRIVRTPQVVGFHELVLMWERAGLYAPLDFLFRAEKGQAGHLGLRNLILNEFKYENVVTLGRIVPITLDTVFVDYAYDQIKSDFDSVHLPSCHGCSKELSVGEDPDGCKMWLCGHCGETVRAVTDSECDALAEDRRKAIEWYEQS